MDRLIGLRFNKTRRVSGLVLFIIQSFKIIKKLKDHISSGGESVTLKVRITLPSPPTPPIPNPSISFQPATSYQTRYVPGIHG
jgi:hypothetical protein